MTNTFLFILLGLFAGALSGLMGIGGGIVIIPALIYVFGMSMHQAQGTTLALMIPPIGILAAWTYYQKGFVDMRAAGLICAGFVIGGYLGSKLAVALPGMTLQRIFGFVFLFAALKMIFVK